MKKIYCVCDVTGEPIGYFDDEQKAVEEAWDMYKANEDGWQEEYMTDNEQDAIQMFKAENGNTLASFFEIPLQDCIVIDDEKVEQLLAMFDGVIAKCENQNAFMHWTNAKKIVEKFFYENA